MSDISTRRKPLRLWPGVVAAVLVVLSPLLLPTVIPSGGMLGMLAFGVAIAVWWLFFSRAAWSERLGVVAVMVVAVAVTSRFVDPSVSNGMMGMMLPMLSIPVQGLTLVAWAVVTRGLADGPRRAGLVVAVLLACGVFVLMRTGGISGGGSADLHWRWTPTPEERLLASAKDAAVPPAPAPQELPSAPAATLSKTAAAPAVPAAAATLATREDGTGRVGSSTSSGSSRAESRDEWPGFRGPERDSVVRGVRIDTDWAKSPPVEMWRQAIGPGWSSFSVHGDLFYTQEQRGEDEIVACYRVSTGAPVWKHRDAARFWESNGGAGPRATPTLSHSRVYAFGATGLLNALDPASGAVIWTRNVASDTRSEIPEWGFASSPLIVNDIVIVAAAGTLAAYDLATGNPRWVGPHHGGSYSSPQLVTIDGVPQVLLLSPPGATSVAPADGALLWEHSWPGPGSAIVQPAVTADGDVLINAIAMTGGAGVRRIAVAHSASGWTTTERWTSSGLKPYFNDFVVHKGHAYGFDGSILSSIDLADGKRTWKGGRYGNGQLVLLADQDLLLITTEDGELALVSATPDKFTELAHVPALDGKTWNHPVLVGDVLLVRNGQEMVAFRLALQGR